LNSFESLQSLGVKSFVFYFAKENTKLKLYRIMIGSSVVWVTNLCSHIAGGRIVIIIVVIIIYLTANGLSPGASGYNACT
jgi:hypothetical protein